MHDILLINPNTSAATTAMMVEIAQSVAPADYRIRGVTAAKGVPMIVNADQLAASAEQVLTMWEAYGAQASAIIIAAFGDPGIEVLQALTDRPVVGICEASMREAAQEGRRFGIATVTPDLVKAIDANADLLGLSDCYSGIRLTSGEPRALAADPQRLEAALADAVDQCIQLDGAQAVIIGGGPLGQAAITLSTRFAVPVIAPIPSAVRRAVALCGDSTAAQ